MFCASCAENEISIPKVRGIGNESYLSASTQNLDSTRRRWYLQLGYFFRKVPVCHGCFVSITAAS